MNNCTFGVADYGHLGFYNFMFFFHLTYAAAGKHWKFHVQIL